MRNRSRLLKNSPKDSSLSKILEQNFWRFYPHTFAFVASQKKWYPFDYLVNLSTELTEAIVDGGARYLVSMPPRHGKSEFLSYWLPIWFLSSFPNKRIILASYAADLSLSFGRKIRNEIVENHLINMDISADSKAANRFNTKDGGGLITAGVGGPITGQGADLFIIDDPFKNWEEASSPTIRQKVIDWWASVARTRLEPGASVIVIQTRWHEEDLIGHLKQTDDVWKEINLPAINENGEALCPDRYSLSDLKDIKRDIGSHFFESLYQQNPVPTEGGLIKRAWWRTYSERPKDITRIVQFWDCAQKVGITNDYSVCATWGESPTGYYLLDLFKDRLEAPQLETTAQSLYAKHQPSAVVIEDKSSGSSLIQSLRQKTRLPIVAYDPKQRDKQVRAAAATPTIESGNCYLPTDKPWVEDFIIEHERFPNVKHDDQVDTTSMMVEYFQKPKRRLRIGAI